MDLSKIKQFVKQNGDKFIFVENGEPEMVMMSFREYEKILANGGGHGSHAAVPAVAPRERTSGFGQVHEHFAAFSSQEFEMETGDEGADEVEDIGMIPEKQGMQERRTAPGRLENIRLEDLPI